MPSMWIVAGPNGAGKTTITKSRIFDRLAQERLVYLNADERTAKIRAQEPTLSRAEANLRAAIITDALVEDYIERDVSFVVETVLSSAKYKDDVVAALQKGFFFGLVYVAVISPEISLSRVRNRVRLGGHDVPEASVRARWLRSLDNLPWFWQRAHWAQKYDNSDPRGGRPVMIAEKAGLKVSLLQPGLNPEIDRRLAKVAGRAHTEGKSHE